MRLPVLLYHRVAAARTTTNAESRDLTVTPREFAAQLAWLHRAGFHAIRMDTLLRALRGSSALPTRPVLLTFDDGYVDATRTIAPLLERYGWPGTFFVITGRMRVRGFLGRTQIASLDRLGMDIGSHTVEHVPLVGLGPQALRFELGASTRTLQGIVGHPILSFAYPFGDLNTRAQRAVRAAGYQLAFTTRPGPLLPTDSWLAEPRIDVHSSQTLNDFARMMQRVR